MTSRDAVTATDLATVIWRTSSRSANAGGNCVEVGVVWRTSTRSGSGGGSNCVEVGTGGSRVLVRDSKNRDGGLLAVSSAAWTAFATSLRTPAA